MLSTFPFARRHKRASSLPLPPHSEIPDGFPTALPRPGPAPPAANRSPANWYGLGLAFLFTHVLMSALLDTLWVIGRVLSRLV